MIGCGLRLTRVARGRPAADPLAGLPARLSASLVVAAKLRAADLYADAALTTPAALAGPVKAWRDHAPGVVPFVQADSAKVLTYQANGLAGTTGELRVLSKSSPVILAGNCTIIARGYYTAGTIWIPWAGAGSYATLFSTGSGYLMDDVPVALSLTNPGTGAVLLRVRRTGATTEFWANNGTKTTDTTLAGSFKIQDIGSQISYSQYGDTASLTSGIVAYTAALIDPEIAAVDAWLGG